jgi:RHS repeat-associated protein
VTKTYKYDAFGVEYDITANDTNYFRYCGQYYDTESGTFYLRARYYDPALGRFTQQDSWSNSNTGDPLSLNLYSYCKCNPIIYVDLSGCWPTWGQVFAAAAIVAVTVVTVAAVVATAGVAGAAIGAAVGAYIGASATSAAVATISGVVTAGIYSAATMTALTGLSDAGEALTGTNVYRDYVMGGDQKAYNALEFGLDVVNAASTYVGAAALAMGFGDNSNDDNYTPAPKKVPNPNGKKGGEAHQAEIAKQTSILKDQDYDIAYEVKIETPKGSKPYRYADFSYTKDGVTQYGQVGKQLQSGIPCARERAAMADIRSTGAKVTFYPYNSIK